MTADQFQLRFINGALRTRRQLRPVKLRFACRFLVRDFPVVDGHAFEQTVPRKTGHSPLVPEKQPRIVGPIRKTAGHHVRLDHATPVHPRGEHPAREADGHPVKAPGFDRGDLHFLPARTGCVGAQKKDQLVRVLSDGKAKVGAALREADDAARAGVVNRGGGRDEFDGEGSGPLDRFDHRRVETLDADRTVLQPHFVVRTEARLARRGGVGALGQTARRRIACAIVGPEEHQPLIRAGPLVGQIDFLFHDGAGHARTAELRLVIRPALDPHVGEKLPVLAVRHVDPCLDLGEVPVETADVDVDRRTAQLRDVLFVLFLFLIGPAECYKPGVVRPARMVKLVILHAGRLGNPHVPVAVGPQVVHVQVAVAASEGPRKIAVIRRDGGPATGFDRGLRPVGQFHHRSEGPRQAGRHLAAVGRELHIAGQGGGDFPLGPDGLDLRRIVQRVTHQRTVSRFGRAVNPGHSRLRITPQSRGDSGTHAPQAGAVEIDHPNLARPALAEDHALAVGREQRTEITAALAEDFAHPASVARIVAHQPEVFRFTQRPAVVDHIAHPDHAGVRAGQFLHFVPEKAA